MRRRSHWLRCVRGRRPLDHHDGAGPLVCPVDAVRRQLQGLETFGKWPQARHRPVVRMAGSPVLRASKTPCAGKIPVHRRVAQPLLPCKPHPVTAPGRIRPEPISVGRNLMRTRQKIGILLLTSTAMIAPAAAQNAPPNPNQAAAKALLQAADKAIGASNVKSVVVAGTGWMGYPGQQFAQGDLPRSDLKSFTYTADGPSKSAKF